MLDLLIKTLGSNLRLLLPNKIWKFLQKIKRFFFRSLSKRVNSELIVSQLKKNGVEEGQLLYVYSSISKIGNLQGGVKTLFNALVECVGAKGTLCFPCHLDPLKIYQDAERGLVVDLREKNSHTGALPNYVCGMKNSFRSSHPFASTIAYGKLAEFITKDHHIAASICHRDSPLARFYSNGGILIGIGTDFSAIAFYHLLEELETFPFEVYETAKKITYVDYDGNWVSRLIKKYDKKISSTRIERPGGRFIREYFYEYLIKENILKEFKIGAAKSWIMSSERLYEFLVNQKKRGVTIYTTKEELKKIIDHEKSINH